MGSCLEEADCYQLSNNYIGISFKKIFDGKADTISFVGITAPSTDSIFYPYTRASSIQLELNPYETSTDFTLESTFGVNTLAIGYLPTIEFVSEDCGTRTILSGLNVNNYNYDSVRIVNALLTNPAQLNVEVFRCPRNNQLKLAFRKMVNGVEVADTVQLNSIIADYSSDFYFPTGKISTVNLPLNPGANTTTFTFEFSDNSVYTLDVQYFRTISNEYARCSDWTLISGLASPNSTFSQVALQRDSIHDPPLTNFAIFK